METGLEPLLAEGVITEVLARLQSGKEAEVYVVRFGGKIVAAKVYKDRAHRSFKNNAIYKEGRGSRNTRSARAMERGSKFGKAAAEDAWKSAEADAAYTLHAAKVRVPEPVIFLDGVLLMELVLDKDGNAARRIIDTDLTPGEANAAYHDMLTQLVRILCCDLIHGDLSPYNVLWSYAGPVIIDFPQIISAAHNSLSERFFLRDAENILGHYARIDPSLMARRGDAREIWRAYLRRELTPDFLPTGRLAMPSPPRLDLPRRELPHHSTLPNMTPRGGAPHHSTLPNVAPRADGPRPGPGRMNGGRPSNGSHREPPHPQHQQQPQQQQQPPGRGPGGRPQSDLRRAVHAPEVIVRHPRAGGVQPSAGSSPPPPPPERSDFTPRRPPPPPAPRSAPNGASARTASPRPNESAPREDVAGENDRRPAHRRRRRRH